MWLIKMASNYKNVIWVFAMSQRRWSYNRFDSSNRCTCIWIALFPSEVHARPLAECTRTYSAWFSLFRVRPRQRHVALHSLERFMNILIFHNPVCGCHLSYINPHFDAYTSSRHSYYLLSLPPNVEKYPTPPGSIYY